MSSTGTDPDTLIERAQSERSSLTEDAVVAYEWFDDRCGEMVVRGEAVSQIADHLDCDEEWANTVISDLVGDSVDPVQQIRTDGTKYVGIIDFEAFEEEGAYGYELYDDVDGRRKRVVCAQCVRNAETPSDVSHATAGDGSLPDDAEYDRLLNRVTSHYASAHDCAPNEIEVGASLIAGTTIDGNTTWHAGNDGQGSGLDADSVKGRDLSSEFDGHTSETDNVHGAPDGADLAHEETLIETFPTELETDQSLFVDVDGNITARSADTDVFTVADEDERLALDQATQGDFAIQEDIEQTFVFTGGDVDDDDNWSEFSFNRYTDTEAVEAVDAEVTESADSVSALDTEVSGKADAGDVSDIQQSSDVDHDSTAGGTGGTPHDHADPDDPVTQFGTGELQNGQMLTAEDGSLTGVESDIDTVQVPDVDSLPEQVEGPTIAYIDAEDEYARVNKE